jgi:HEAT repeat protein
MKTSQRQFRIWGMVVVAIASAALAGVIVAAPILCPDATARYSPWCQLALRAAVRSPSAAAIVEDRTFNHPASSLDLIAKQLTRQDDAIASLSAHLLAQHGDDRAVDRLAADLGKTQDIDRQGRILADLERFFDKRPDSVDAAFLALRLSQDYVFRNKALNGLLYPVPAPGSVARLCAALRSSESVDHRQQYALWLGMRHATEAVDPLIQTLVSDPDADMRRECLSALGTIHDDRAIAPMITAIQDADAAVRGFAARRLGDFVHDQTALDALLAGLSTSDIGVRAQCALALGETIKAPAAIPVLMESLLADDPSVRDDSHRILVDYPLSEPETTRFASQTALSIARFGAFPEPKMSSRHSACGGRRGKGNTLAFWF